ncbi:MAG: hypothetical protein DI527_18780 [Chelatococcus sp.]|nr:MAG: hypothetical protein DI527_18780 [Chelatococcus sp.]
MSHAPMTLDELAKRLANAAQMELFAINIMECGAARVNAPFVLTDVVRETRRQGEALGLAHRIATALRDRPDLAIGLGLNDLVLEPAATPIP